MLLRGDTSTNQPNMRPPAFAVVLQRSDDSGRTHRRTTRLSPDKRRSQEKTHLLRLEFFWLRSPLDGARGVLTCRARCSVAEPCDPVGWVFSTSGFHRFLATKPVSFRNQQSRTALKFGDHSSIRDSWPIAFSVYPRGPRVGNETGCPRHTAPN